MGNNIFGDLDGWKRDRDHKDAEDKAVQLAREYGITVPPPDQVMTDDNMPKVWPTLTWFMIWYYLLTKKQQLQIRKFKFDSGTGNMLSLNDRRKLKMTDPERPPTTEQEAVDDLMGYVEENKGEIAGAVKGQFRRGGLAHHPFRRHHKKSYL